ncbi:hypothetical protein QA645_24835 [Bradyrhizobium sp. CIAT3101]|uniref:hypothetical protein n=1 Tax=Bradyrhizobium sp. CIAT3101 TaxID=439387 RepID=UPI0024B1E782|nr:hypothetical protein [Bradyrhizobium sp. CIAT3101]WFU77774.1 hypothetical protein QA645_24835 [Bradyrhizobium sp. CIAT3101]
MDDAAPAPVAIPSSFADRRVRLAPKLSETNVSDIKRRDWAARTIALLAVVVVLVGALLLFNAPNRERRTAITTSCSQFEADAHKLFGKGDTAVLSASFAAGDNVHLAIDFKGVGYVWELTGVLATARKDVTGSGSFTTVTKSKSTSAAANSGTSTISHGEINGFATLDVASDIIAAGEGGIVIANTNSLPPFALPRVASASCEASKGPVQLSVHATTK